MELPHTKVRLHLGETSPPPDGDSIYPLHSGDRTIGYLETHLTEEDDSPGQREGLRLLANEMAVLLERARFLETQLQLKRELAEKSHLENLGRMAATIAHNVKNPLSSIKTLLQLLREEDNLTSEQKDEIGMMTREVDRLAKTVSSLLNFSRLDGIEAKSPARDLINANELLRSMETVFRGDLESNNLKLQTHIDPTTLRLRSDADILNDILSNLISNAIEASPGGGVIKVGMEQRGQHLTIMVEDEGPGIPFKMREKALEPFFTTKSRGTGLGLAIVGKRAEQLGGRLSIEDTAKRRGTRVVVRLTIDDSMLSLEDHHSI
jgi:signal transduction histidine kinase